ncbi:MAG: DNA repair exonuclease [Gemmatimonadetes bacterium]|nr:DNA repair exonuclease [Gemmatimonadota bacterium]
MLIAHLADLHLGYRAYHRLAPGGINARERDVARAFRAALDRVIELRPELVLVAGDVFHTVRPSNSAIADAFRQFARLAAALPEAPIVVIAGNHDSPRAVETGSILRLLAEIPGVLVVDDAARSLYLEALDTSVLCLPHNALTAGEVVAIEPDVAAGTNILLLHGTVAGGAAEQKLRYVSEYGGAKVETSEIRPEFWDYVALGHYHIATELAPNMWYAGAVERTSTNIWEEIGSEKGFVTYDTERRRGTFHPVPTREVLDLPRFSARGMTPAEIDARIRALVEEIPGGMKGKIVRLIVTDVTRDLFRELDHRYIRELKAEALHFHLDARRPEVRRVVGYGAPGRRRTLDEEVESFLRLHWQPSSPEIDRERLVALAARFMAEAAKGELEDALVDSREA